MTSVAPLSRIIGIELVDLKISMRAAVPVTGPENFLPFTILTCRKTHLAVNSFYNI
ncbi:MAG: hypothetical protein AAE987_03225 [Thermoplasmataceae archaeon]|jgi:hypothetical protein